MLFTSDRGITPAQAARAAEAAGLRLLLRARAHPHPGPARCAAPAHRHRGAARRPVPAHARPVGGAEHGRRGHHARSGSARRSRCPPSMTRSRWPRPSPRSTTCPAGGSSSAWASAGTPTSSPTTGCRPESGARCCASTWRPCRRCGRRRRPATRASSSASAPRGRGRSRRSSADPGRGSGRAAASRPSAGSRAAADGWLTTPGETGLDGKVALLHQAWQEAGRDGPPGHGAGRQAGPGPARALGRDRGDRRGVRHPGPLAGRGHRLPRSAGRAAGPGQGRVRAGPGGLT